MIVWICTDMEGLAGVDDWEHCYAVADDDPRYLFGLEQLAGDTNAAVAGCFDAGATEVRVLDGHGRNRNRGLAGRLDPRARLVWIARRDPVRWEGLDSEVQAVAVIGQHAMAGTIGGFLDHTQIPKQVCRLTAAGREIGELAQIALHTGAFGIPVAYVSGDEALCREAHALLPHVVSTVTKQGTGWATCALRDPATVRAEIRRDIARALGTVRRENALEWASPFEVTLEWAWTEPADRMAKVHGVRRVDARTVAWTLRDACDIHTWPSAAWSPDGADPIGRKPQ
ncbi:MAG: M55 family metallopeptidase [Armatimonadota bacterium]